MNYVHKATYFGSGVIYERFYASPRKSLHKWFNTGSPAPWEEDEKVPDAKEALATSLYRTKRTLKFLCLSNVWDWFVTLTVSPDKCDRYSADGLRKMMARFTLHLRRLGCQYVLVPEPHANGAWHIHGFIKGPLDVVEAKNKNGGALFTKRNHHRVYNVPSWQDYVGFTDAIKVEEKNALQVTKYVTKYITKSLLTSSNWGSSKKRYWASRDLKRAEEKTFFNFGGHPKDGVDGWTKCRDYDVWFRWLVPGTPEYVAFVSQPLVVVSETPPDWLFGAD